MYGDVREEKGEEWMGEREREERVYNTYQKVS